MFTSPGKKKLGMQGSRYSGQESTNGKMNIVKKTNININCSCMVYFHSTLRRISTFSCSNLSALIGMRYNTTVRVKVWTLLIVINVPNTPRKCPLKKVRAVLYKSNSLYSELIRKKQTAYCAFSNYEIYSYVFITFITFITRKLITRSLSYSIL